MTASFTMNNDFFAQMIALRDSVAPLAQDLQNPEVRSLIIRRRYVPEGEMVPISEYLAIKPWPLITNVSPRLIGLPLGSSGITVESTDLQVKQLSRAYTEEQLVGSGTAYFVDAVLEPNGRGVSGGFEADFVSLVIENALSWSMVLRRRIDQEG